MITAYNQIKQLVGKSESEREIENSIVSNEFQCLLAPAAADTNPYTHAHAETMFVNVFWFFDMLLNNLSGIRKE